MENSTEENVKAMVKLMKDLRIFQEDDYDGFAGVESDQPLINCGIVIIEKEHKLENCIMIIDDCHVEIYYYPYMDNPEDDDVMGRDEKIWWKEFEDQDDILTFLGHEAKNLEGEGVPVNILHLYGFKTF